MNIRTVKYDYHHLGIPTTEVRKDEIYSPTFKMYTSCGEKSEFRVQFHRFAADSPLHPIIKNAPHVAFKVDSIDAAIEGKTVILGPYFPFPGFRVAIIINEETNTAIEFVETDLSEVEIWSPPETASFIYPDAGQ